MEEQEEEEKEEPASDIKSNNPHLAGGEKHFSHIRKINVREDMVALSALHGYQQRTSTGWLRK